MKETQVKKIKKILKPSEKHWVGDGFYVSTLFSMHSVDPQEISPFLLLDHASPREFPPTESKKGVGVHPHRGFETVTFAIQGEVDHRDSGGGGGTITTGGVQWMTAGSGVVHEEYHSKNFAKEGGVFEMLQLWVNLPAKDKMTSPRYQSMDKEDFPEALLNEGKAQLKVIAGQYEDLKGPAKTYTPMNIFEVFSKKDQDLVFDLPEASNTLIVQLKGQSEFSSESHLDAGQVAILNQEGQQVALKASEGSHFVVLNGKPIDEPVMAYGPFVMNTKAQILEAVRDFESGKMGTLVKEYQD